MQPTSALCREQESVQRARAADAVLDNVRVIAERAANAWGAEAVAAERREARAANVALVAARARAEPAPESPADHRQLSENPDRGFADV